MACMKVRPCAVRPATVLPALAAAATLCGCARLDYDRLRVGRELRDVSRALPEDHSARSDWSVCYQRANGLGRTDVIVVLLTRDRRIAAKFHVVHNERQSVLGQDAGYALTGEFDAELLGLSEAGPRDRLRALAADLMEPQADPFVREAHAWVAAGLVRMLALDDPADADDALAERLVEMLERVPAGGRATTSPGGGAVVRIAYHHGQTW